MIILERHIVDENGEYMCCKYNPGIMCEKVCCPANCGWRPQIERIRKRQTSADVVGLPGIHIECKRVENLNVYNALAQAIRDTGESGDLPAVFHRKNNQPWLVTMRLDDWLKIFSGKE